MTHVAEIDTNISGEGAQTNVHSGVSRTKGSDKGVRMKLSPQDIDRLEAEREADEIASGRIPLTGLQPPPPKGNKPLSGTPRRPSQNWNHRHGSRPGLDDLEKRIFS